MLDRQVLEKLTGRRVVGQALCVPIGLVQDDPDHWEIVGVPDGPVQKRAELRDVYVHICVCKEPAYQGGPLSGLKAHGHLLHCLSAVPLFSIVDTTALKVLHHCFKEWDMAHRGGKFEVTIYDTKAFADADTLPLAVCLAALRGRA